MEPVQVAATPVEEPERKAPRSNLKYAESARSFLAHYQRSGMGQKLSVFCEANNYRRQTIKKWRELYPEFARDLKEIQWRNERMSPAQVEKYENRLRARGMDEKLLHFLQSFGITYDRDAALIESGLDMDQFEVALKDVEDFKSAYHQIRKRQNWKIEDHFGLRAMSGKNANDSMRWLEVHDPKYRKKVDVSVDHVVRFDQGMLTGRREEWQKRFGAMSEQKQIEGDVIDAEVVENESSAE